MKNNFIKKMKNLINSIHSFLTKNKLVVIVIILISLGGAVYGFWPKETTETTITKETSENTITIGDGNKFEGVLIAQDSPGAHLEINENKSMPYTHQFTILEGKFGQEKWEELYNVKFLLPNNKDAFLPVLKEGKKYIIASTFEDCSDITVSEAYQISDNFDESNVCFTKRLFCGEDERNIALDPVRNEIDDNKKALNMALQNKDENELNILFQKGQSLYRNFNEIISYATTEEALDYPLEKCAKLKE